MALTDQQRDHIMKQSVETIRKFINDGLVKFPDDLKKYKDNPKFIAIQNSIANMPNPKAAKRWAEISAMDSSSDPLSLAATLSDFINQYGASKGDSDIIKQAREQLAKVTSQLELTAWEKLDKSSITEMLAYRRTYPATVHESELDELVWKLIDRTVPEQIHVYQSNFPNGKYRNECDAILEAQSLWQGVSEDADIVTVSDYIMEMPSSPFINDAIELAAKLKSEEISKMLENPSGYDVNDLKLLVKEKIFTHEELISHGVCTEKTLKYLENPPQLPDIEQNGEANPVVHAGATDVFLFGIPSSGKTCVLMGLLGAHEFSYDNASEGHGGAYADDLYLYRKHGKAPGRTYGNFVTQIPGVIRPDNTAQIVFPINLIEMSGEEFAMKMAYNSEHTVNFEDMGTGASRLLTSGNNKVIFIVIDPTSDGLITIATERADGSTEKKIVQQDIVISKIVNMLARNPKVLKRTNAIHFIMTKADTLGPREVRNQLAVDRVKALYHNTIENLRDICAKYSINATSENAPKLFTFSLGQFFIGDMFEYDDTDANMIMGNLQSMCQGIKQKGFFDKVKDTVN